MSVVFVRCREVLARVDAGAAVARERVGALARREEAVAVVRAEGEHVPPRRLPADRLGTGRFEGGGTTESCTLTRDIIRVSKQTYTETIRGHTIQ